MAEPYKHAFMQINDWYNDSADYFTFDGYRYFYKTEGNQGAYLLLIHGFPTSSWDWHKVWMALSQQYRLIAVDMLGFGYSDKPNGINYTIHHQARMHEALLRHLGVDQCHILAHDYGDTVAQELLAACQDRKIKHDHSLDYQSICFLNGGLFPEMHRAVLTQKLLHSRLGFLFNKALNRSSLQKTFDKIFGINKATDVEIDQLYDIMNYKNGRSNLHRLIKYIRDRRDHRERWVGAMQRSKIPVRLINGPADPISGIHLVDYYNSIIPNPDTVVIEGAGHYPQLETPDELIKHYFEFREVIN